MGGGRGGGRMWVEQKGKNVTAFSDFGPVLKCSSWCYHSPSSSGPAHLPHYGEDASTWNISASSFGPGRRFIVAPRQHSSPSILWCFRTKFIMRNEDGNPSQLSSESQKPPLSIAASRGSAKECGSDAIMECGSQTTGCTARLKWLFWVNRASRSKILDTMSCLTQKGSKAQFTACPDV